MVKIMKSGLRTVVKFADEQADSTSYRIACYAHDVNIIIKRFWWSLDLVIKHTNGHFLKSLRKWMDILQILVGFNYVKKAGPRRFGDTTSYRLFLYTL